LTTDVSKKRVGRYGKRGKASSMRLARRKEVGTKRTSLIEEKGLT